MEFIKTKTPIQICDVGASPIDKTEFIDNLINNVDSYLYGFEPNKEEFSKLNKKKKQGVFRLCNRRWNK